MQTTSFELSKKLEELGVKYICPSFCWCFNGISARHHVRLESEKGIPAYTLDELLEMLPPCIGKTKEEIYTINYLKHTKIIKQTDGFGKAETLYAFYYFDDKNKKEFFFEHKNPAEAAGQLLAWCIENGYVEGGKINEEKKDG